MQTIIRYLCLEFEEVNKRISKAVVTLSGYMESPGYAAQDTPLPFRNVLGLKIERDISVLLNVCPVLDH